MQLSADGPLNLLQAVTLAASPAGVVSNLQLPVVGDDCSRNYRNRPVRATITLNRRCRSTVPDVHRCRASVYCGRILFIHAPNTSTLKV